MDEENDADDEEEAVLDQDHEPPIEPNRTMREDFRAYCKAHKDDFLNLSTQEKTTDPAAQHPERQEDPHECIP